MNEREILVAYVRGVISRTDAMACLGLTWYGDLLLRLDAHGLEGPRASVEQEKEMQRAIDAIFCSNWKTKMDRRLLASGVEAWPTGMLWNEAAFAAGKLSRSTFGRWLDFAVASGRLRKVRAGLYLNALGNKDVSVGAAAGYLRRTAIPSLSWVLAQEEVTPDTGGAITCVLSTTSGLTAPDMRPVMTSIGEFRFRPMPCWAYELDNAPVDDWRDNRFQHPRATPEKALCDWLFLSATSRNPTSPPPYEVDLMRLNIDRLVRLAAAMHISKQLDTWLEAHRRNAL